MELSFAQERMWFLEQFEPDSSANNCSTTVELTGALSVALLEQCLNEIVRRHEALRTRFPAVDGRPSQVIEPELRLRVAVVDLSGAGLDDRALRGLAQEESRRVFALARAPLLRLTLFRRAAERHLLQLSAHHIVWDAGSVSVFLRELLRLHEAYRRGLPTPLAPLRAQYRDFARAERALVETPRARADLDFWRRRLGDLAPLRLPTDFPRPDAPAFRGASHEFELSEDLTEAVQAYCARRSVSPFMLLLAALQWYLSLLSGERRIAVGAPIANRTRPEWEELAGAFINVLVFTGELGAGEDFESYLRRVRDEALRVYEHAEYPFVKLVDEINPARRLNVSPLFQVMLVYLSLPPPRLDLAGLDGRLWNVESVTSKQDLTLTINVWQERLLAAWEYNTELFRRETIELFSRQFVGLLEALTADRPLSPAALMEPDEQARQAAWNATSRPASPELGILPALRAPDDRVALVHGEQHVSYRTLRAEVAGWAARLRAHGVGPETTVGVLVPRSIETIAALLAVWAAGGSYVPLDERWPAARVAEIVACAGVELVLAGESTRAMVATLGVPALVMEGRTSGAAAVGWSASPSQAAYTIFTSGSTGRPKGIVVPRAAVANLLASFVADLDCHADDVFLALTTISFDIAVLEWAVPLLVGGCVVVLTHDQVRDPQELRAVLDRHRPTRVQATPSLWRALVDAGWEGQPRGLAALVGGESLADDLAAGLRARCPEVWNVYGPTETTIWSMAARLVDDRPPDLGAPIANTSVRVLDAALRPLPLGFEGEAFIGGAGLARGYLNQPRLTAERYLPDPWSRVPGARLFRTGDRVRWGSDARLRFVARRDEQVKIRGLRVEPAEIEACLRLHAAVREAVVVLHGTGAAARLVAYLTLHDAPARREDASAAALARFVRERLPEYMVPGQFVTLDALPLTTSGKVARKALPPPPAPASPSEAAAARLFSPVEHEAQAAWCKSLGREHVRPRDNFFELGGNSILAAQVCLTLTKVLGVRVPVRTLFESAVFEQFATRLEALRRGGQSELLPEIVPDAEHGHDPFPLTEVQEAYLLGRRGVFDLGQVSTHSYFEIESERIDVERFESAWRTLIRRHGMLRAVFEGDASQRVLETVPDYVVRRLDLREASPPERERALLEVRAEMSHAVHPADVWPLFEIRATRLDERLTRFHFSVDALIADAFSSVILADELRAFYVNPEADLPAPGLSFRDYVLGLGALAGSALHRESEEYWLSRLDSDLRGPDLPVVRGRLAEAARFGRRSLRLGRDDWQALRAAALRRGLSPTSAVLSAFAQVLGWWSRTQRFLLNLTLFNRLPLHPDVGRIVGDFTSITLLEVDAREAATFEDLARRVQARLWDDLDHRFFGGVRVLREMRRRAGGGQEILAPVVFTSTLGMNAGDAPAEEWGREVFSISQTPQVWLDHKVFEDGGELGVDWDCAEALFPDGALDAMFAAYERLLGALARDDRAWSEERARQRERLLASAPARADVVRFEGAATLHGLFLEQARRHPGRPAVIARDRRLTFAELDAASARRAAALSAAGARPEEVVAVVVPKGWEQAVAVLGVLRAGGAYLPIEAHEPEDRRLRMLQNADVRLVATTDELAIGMQWPGHVRLITGSSAAGAGVDEEPTVRSDRLAYVIYTSGSTGQPKGVMIEHGAAVNTLRDLAQRLGLAPHDRTLALSALSFDLSVFDCFGVWAAGGAVVYPDPARLKDPGHWARLLESEGVTVWNTVPALMEMLVEGTAVSGTPLRWILLSGDWIPVSLPGRARERWPDARQLGLGGATEASIWSILHPIDRVEPDWTRIPYGRAMCNQTVTVLDERLEPVPTWVVGEIYIGGAGLARGYLANPGLTAERFVTHPRSGERLYRTGDLGRLLPSGEVDILGRADQQVKVNGYRVELAEIETVLEQQPEIQQAVVDLDVQPTGGKELVAYLVERRRSAPTAQGAMRLAAAVSTKLAQRGLRDCGSAAFRVDLDGGRTTEDELARVLARQSYRFFSETPVPLAVLDALIDRATIRLSASAPAEDGGPTLARLGLALAALRQERVDDNPLPKYRYASAGSLYPVQAYVVAPEGAVPGLEGGAYYYDPRRHSLVRVGLPPATAGASPRLVLVAEMSAIEDQYGEASPAFCMLEAGYMLGLLRPCLGAEVADTGAELGLSASQRVLVAHALRARGAAPAVPPASLLLWARANGLHGASPGFYLREPGAGFRHRAAGGVVEAAWFGPNADLFERSHFALVAFGPDAPRAALLGAGALGQVAMEECSARGVGLCPIGEISPRFLEAAGLEGTIVHGWVGGRIDAAQTRTWLALRPPASGDELRSRCRERVARQLPAYMHPTRYVFVERIPLSANNKVDRAMLKKALDGRDAATSSPSEALGDQIEQEIAGMLRDILQRPVQSLDESFFAMGASSLVIVKLHGMIDARYPERVTFQDLFDRPTVRQIARLVAKDLPGSAQSPSAPAPDAANVITF